tara:strand:+ start:560 stop:1084 length:525 start_codon:yes stop_codon:yes gene_type:complete
MDTKLVVKEYFGNHWTSRTSTYKYSNLSISEKISPQETVIDIGCGDNEFKPLIKNLVGLDFANPKADINIDLDDYTTDKLFDVALCLGSVQYGNQKDMIRQINKVVSLLKPTARIYWRSNTGVRDHKHEMVNIIPYYPWSEQEHYKFAKQFGFNIDFIAEDLYGRLYVEWSRHE